MYKNASWLSVSILSWTQTNCPLKRCDATRCNSIEYLCFAYHRCKPVWVLGCCRTCFNAKHITTGFCMTAAGVDADDGSQDRWNSIKNIMESYASELNVQNRQNQWNWMRVERELVWCSSKECGTWRTSRMIGTFEIHNSWPCSVCITKIVICWLVMLLLQIGTDSSRFVDWSNLLL